MGSSLKSNRVSSPPCPRYFASVLLCVPLLPPPQPLLCVFRCFCGRIAVFFALFHSFVAAVSRLGFYLNGGGLPGCVLQSRSEDLMQRSQGRDPPPPPAVPPAPIVLSLCATWPVPETKPSQYFEGSFSFK